MLSKTFMLAAAATTLMAGAAFAQDAATSYPDKASTPPDQLQNSPTSSHTVNPTPDNNLTPSARDKNNQSPVSANVPDSSSAPTVHNELVTNGPVPDTKANRAQYGGPQSQAGKMTRAKGN
jgi:hypothetical protein